jgi:ATP/ADP translocase
MAELWGSVVVSVLFWGFANQITTVEEASQFYPLFGLGANVALIFSGQAVKYFSLVRHWVETLDAMFKFTAPCGPAHTMRLGTCSLTVQNAAGGCL